MFLGFCKRKPSLAKAHCLWRHQGMHPTAHDNLPRRIALLGNILRPNWVASWGRSFQKNHASKGWKGEHVLYHQCEQLSETWKFNKAGNPNRKKIGLVVESSSPSAGACKAVSNKRYSCSVILVHDNILGKHLVCEPLFAWLAWADHWSHCSLWGCPHYDWLLQVAVILLKYDKSEYKTYSLPNINKCVTTPTDILATSGCNFCGIGFGQDWIGHDFLPWFWL